MRDLIRTLVLLSVVTLAGCGGDDAPPANDRPAQVGTEFVLRYGESADVGPMMLRFVAVTEDSRCPVDVMCVWAGNARIQIVATTGLHTDLLELNTTLDPRIAMFEGHVIELVRLEPLPTTTAPNPAATTESYKATLIVDGQVTSTGG